jgi:hypothetical protein
MLFGVDYSAGVPSVAALKAAGAAYVCRYISPGTRRKDLTRAEADTMRAAGIGVVTVYEDTTGDARAGRDGGRANAAFARDELARLGAPPGAPCYLAVDYDARGAELATAVDYVRGAADVLGTERTGVYGGFYVVKACLDAGACRFGWQTLAWSDRQWDPRAHLQQHLGQTTIGGVVCDRNYATQPGYGQWDDQEDAMPLSAEDITAVRQVVKEEVGKVYRLLARGDDPVPATGQTHPWNLKEILTELEDLAPAAAPTLTDAQLETLAERLAPLVAARVEIAGMPTYTGTVVTPPGTVEIRPGPELSTWTGHGETPEAPA